MSAGGNLLQRCFKNGLSMTPYSLFICCLKQSPFWQPPKNPSQPRHEDQFLLEILAHQKLKMPNILCTNKVKRTTISKKIGDKINNLLESIKWKFHPNNWSTKCSNEGQFVLDQSTNDATILIRNPYIISSCIVNYCSCKNRSSWGDIMSQNKR